MRAGAVLAGLLLAGCTAVPPPAPPLPTTTPPKPAPHPPAPRTHDQDDRKVLDTLASLNPCALVEGDRVRLWGPHRCTVGSVQVFFTERTPRAERFSLPAKVIDGVKVDAVKRTHDQCSMEIPVSFAYAVAVSAGRCDVLDGVAATVIARLAKPAKARHPAHRPDLSKDACDVLTGAFPKADADGQRRAAFDACSWDVPQVGPVYLELFFQREPPEGQVWTKWATVAGKQVYVNAKSRCGWAWSEGAYSAEQARSVVLSVDCGTRTWPPEQAKALITVLMARLGKPQPPIGTTKLTYRAGEPDEPSPGACVDYQPDACEPHQPTPVPTGVGPATLMAQTDSHVTCSAALDAVRGQFPALRPVVDTQQLTCVFVQPDHAVELSFDILSSNETGYRPTTSRELTVGGRAAEYREYRADVAQASLCVDSGQRSAYRSTTLLWCVTATFRPPRNDPGASPDTRGAARLEPVMAALVTEYLG